MDSAKAFGSITLSSFLLETQGRLIDRHIRKNALITLLLHPFQHVYQTGKLIKTAFHYLVIRIEMALNRIELAIGAFFNIQGTLDNISFDSICTSLSEQNISPTVVSFLRSMLFNKEVTVKFNETSVRATVFRECPQGGILYFLASCGA